MNKQEFLAFSLPYELNVYNENLFGREILEVKGLEYNDVIHKYGKSPASYCRLLLRPLSDLTKPIEHKGEKFVPSFILSRDIKIGDDFIMLLVGIINGYEGCQGMNLISVMKYCPLNIAQKLIEWHFDIAGLIEKGEAIDVNTLPENPYK